jgi:hypothetical protein
MPVLRAGVRLFTFGIGHDCNAYFLRKLASLGRGYTDVALKSFSLRQQMCNLIDHAQLPVLTNLTMAFHDENLQQRVSVSCVSSDLSLHQQSSVHAYVYI